ncbi:type I restriction-modification system endonuclease [Sphingomonas ginsenosidivorax]|uniref:Type I restriction-modification system endonuclease n=1 Tax=Sphingomonas ginsenosidivorax TaxID=862135 RepID=A0A5C6UE03_9SPHN|nr:type I restriction-modification system endonuclease [Sphingomonas ginsenosidivorax]TXC70962.1 type I restriction-modification system endonuclease [Sphingomonas ginsenosidivorax]
MGETRGNFAFLAAHSPQLSKLGQLAERYFASDPPAALVKLRQFAEITAKSVAARHALLPGQAVSFDDVLRTLRARSIMPREISDLFYHVKRTGNVAVHEDAGSAGDVLTSLKIAREIGVWFHRSYEGYPDFKPGAFVPPTPPVDASKALSQELATLKATIAASADSEAKALLAAQEAEQRRRHSEDRAAQDAQDKAFWERYAAETEAALRSAEAALAGLQAQASALPAQQLDLLADLAADGAKRVDLDEVTTRVLIDDRLRAAGWTVDSAVLRHGLGTRPNYTTPIAIAEWPTKSGPVDYALFVEGRCVGVIEAKRQSSDVPGRIAQAKRYARDIALSVDELPSGGPWSDGGDRFSVPFMFATNGRAYVKQLATKSGTWFWDARAPGDPPRALVDWFSPRDLIERLEQHLSAEPTMVAERELGVTGLRPYQREAITAVEDAIVRGQRQILLAMATGTGKTRLAIALMYELLRTQRFRRILFLVDRNALGRQTLDAMSTTDTMGFYKFSEVFPVADMARKFPEATDRVQVATVQAMIHRVFDDPGAERPTPGTYDLIIVDEAHRGYTLDAELREDDLGFRNLDDYLSAYRRVLDYFDATKVALTATPALHTRQIFGAPVFRYGYRQAVVDGYLIDHRPPRRITTALSQTGIRFEQGEEVTIFDPRTGEVDLFDLEDQVDFEIAQFNKKVHTRAFNRAVAEAIAAECPPDQPGKTLLFATRDDHADILVDELRAALTTEYGPQPHDLVDKITGSVDKPLDKIKAFKNDPRPKYVVTVDLLTTGIDVPAITNLVFVRRVNSRILYDQMIGRATRRCDEIGKDYFRIFDAVDIYANLQDVTDMRPVVVDPGLTFGTLVGDIERATTDEDRAFVRDQIVVKLRQRIKYISPDRRDALELVVGPLGDLADRLKDAPPADTIALFRQHPSLAAVLDAANPARKGDGIYLSEHDDELLSIEDDFGEKATPGDYIESFEAYVRANMNAVPAMIAATQRPRELTRKELKELAILLDGQGFSEANLRRAYGSARNADIAAHIIGFVRQAALGDPLVPYETRVDNGVQRMLASRTWTPKQRQWLQRIGRVLRAQPVSDPEILSDPLFAQHGGFAEVDRAFDSGLGEVLKDLNAAIWDSARAA